MSSTPFLYPNVTSLPSQGAPSQTERANTKRPGEISDFDRTLDQEISRMPAGAGLATNLGSVREPLKFSAHATQRLQERNIKFDPAMMNKINDAVDKASAKGVEDTLVLTNDAALIVNVKNRTVVTAMDKAQLNGNVFTNIDGAVII